MHPSNNPPNLLIPLNRAPKPSPYPPPDAPAHSVINFPSTLMAFLKSKTLRKNEHILFMDPFGLDHDTIKPATIHIIHAIRRLYAQSGSKVTPKWTQIHLHMPKAIPNKPQIDPKSTKQFDKIIRIRGENECFLKDDPHIPKVSPQ